MARGGPTLELRITADGSKLVGVFHTASGQVREFATGVERASKQAARSLDDLTKSAAESGRAIGLAITGALGTVTAAMAKAIDYGAEIDVVSKRIGSSAEEISSLAAAARRNDADLRTLTDGLQALSVQAARAASGVGQGAKEAGAAFRALGVDIIDTTTRAVKPTTQVMEEVAQRLAALPPGAQRARLELQLFGASGAALDATLQELGTVGMQGVIDKAQETGQLLTTGTAAAMKTVTVRVQELKGRVGELTLQLTAAATPALLAMTGQVGDVESASDDLRGSLGTTHDTFYNLGLIVVTTGATLQTLFTMIYGGIDVVVALAESVITATRGLGSLAQGMEDLKRGNFTAAVASMAAGTALLGNSWAGLKARATGAWSAIESAGADADARIAKYRADYIAAQADMGRAFDKTAKDRKAAEKEQALHDGLVLIRTAALEEASRRQAAAKRNAAQADRAAAAAARTLATAQAAQQRSYMQVADSVDRMRQKLAGASDAEIEYGAAVREANVEMLATIAAHGDAAEAVQKFLDTEALLHEQLELRNKLAGQTVQANEQIADSTQDMARIVDSSAQSMADAFAQWAVDAFDNGKDFAGKMIDLMKSMVAQIIAQWLKLKVFGPILSSFLGGVGTAYAGTGGGGSITGSLVNAGASYAMKSVMGGGGGGEPIATGAASAGGGSGSIFDSASWIGAGKKLYSGFQSAWYGPNYGTYNAQQIGVDASGRAIGASATPYTGNIGYGGYGSALGQGLGIAAGVYAGYNRFQNSGKDIGGAAGGVAYGVGTYYAGAAAATAVATGSIAAGVAAIPVVGWIALAAMLVDKLSGGKLFGTKFRPESSTTSLTIGEGGGTASADLTKVRQKAFFGGKKRTTESVAVSQEAIDAAQALYDAVGETMTSAANALAIDTPRMIDASLQVVQEYTKKGKLKSTEYVVEMFGQSWKEATQDAAVSRINSEALIAVIDSWLGSAADAAAQDVATLPTGADELGKAVNKRIAEIMRNSLDDALPDGGTSTTSTAASYGGEASQIAQRWRDDAEQLAAGAQFLLVAAADMAHGISLIGEDGPGSLTRIADLTEELAGQDEALVDTYVRLQQETQAYKQIMAIAGVQVGATGEDLVRFADRLASAFGGVQNMAQAASQFAELFYGSGSLLASNIEALKQQVAGQLEALGVDDAASLEQFRAAYESVAAQLSPEQLAQWWQAGLALGQLNDAVAQLAQAQGQYATFVEGIERQLGAAGDIPWARQFAGLNGQLDNLIAQANQLARAAGMQGASEKDLLTIRQYVAQQAVAMIASLDQTGKSLAWQLNGGTGVNPAATLDELNAQIAALQSSSSSAAGGIRTAAQSIDSTASLLIGDLSPYSDRKKLDIAKQQLLAGQASKEDVLRIAQRLYASGDDYNQVFEWVRTHGARGATTGSSIAASAGSSNSASLAELIKQRDILQQQQQLQVAQQLATAITNKNEATGESYADIAKDWGYNLDKLAKDLGVNNIQDYLDQLQAQDLPGALGSAGTEIVDAIRQLGADLLAAWGITVTPEAYQPAIHANGSTSAPLAGDDAAGIGVPFARTPSAPNLRADRPVDVAGITDLRADIRALKEVNNELVRIVGRYLPVVAENTELAAAETGRVGSGIRALVDGQPGVPRSTRTPPVYVGA